MTSKSDKSKGILDQINLASEPNYFKATRSLIIGPSASGKSTLAANLAVYLVKRYNNLIIISPSTDDQNLKALAKFCKDAKLNVLWTTIDDKGNLSIPVEMDDPEKEKKDEKKKNKDKEKINKDEYKDIVVPSLSKSLFIIDDYYTQKGMPKALSSLISSLFIKGRHNKNNVIYIAHSNRNIPHEIKLGCNALFIDRPYDNIALSDRIKDTNFSEWYQLDSYTSPSTIDLVQFKPITRDELIRKLKDKLHPEDKGKKLASLQEYQGISIQGNENAVKTIKKTIKEGSSISNNTHLNNIQIDPVIESSYKLFC